MLFYKQYLYSGGVYAINNFSCIHDAYTCIIYNRCMGREDWWKSQTLEPDFFLKGTITPGQALDLGRRGLYYLRQVPKSIYNSPLAKAGLNGYSGFYEKETTGNIGITLCE